jgi:hypothetical protein
MPVRLYESLPARLRPRHTGRMHYNDDASGGNTCANPHLFHSRLFRYHLYALSTAVFDYDPFHPSPTAYRSGTISTGEVAVGAGSLGSSALRRGGVQRHPRWYSAELVSVVLSLSGRSNTMMGWRVEVSGHV